MTALSTVTTGSPEPSEALADSPTPRPRTANRWEIWCILFVSGAGTLALEIVASRFMTPAFGSSLYIWGAILSTTLLCLAAGYRWGGRLADRLESPYQRLVLMILLAAAWIGLVPAIGHVALGVGVGFGSLAGPAFVMVALFAVPITLLATATPLAFGALVRSAPDRPGRALGDLFAISTAGSVAGALIAAYVMVPAVGIRRSFVLIPVALLLVLMPAFFRGVVLRRALVVLGALALQGHLPPNLGCGAWGLQDGVVFVHRTASPYGQLDVLDDRRDGTRLLLLDGASQNWVVGADWSKSMFNYIPAVLRHAPRFGHEGKRALVLGMGAGTLVRGLDALDYEVDVVELDPGVVEVATEFFDFPRDQFDVQVGDARTFVDRAAAFGASDNDVPEYDVIVLDVAGGGNQPAHLFTREAFQAMRGRLKPFGVLVVNLVVRLDPPNDRVARHVLATIAQEYGYVEAFDVNPMLEPGDVTNVVVLASEAPPVFPVPAFVTDRPVAIDRSLRPLSDDWCPLALWSVATNDRWHRNIRDWVGLAALMPN